jgi:outer membrane protein assembly factor BamD (BamD/ComL family)
VLAALDRYLALFPIGEDEVYWLYGQALELNGALRDIRRAYAMYKTLLEGWPRSVFWSQAQDRHSYIERHYLDIR